MTRSRVDDGSLNAKQTEVFDFRKSAVMLADYGFDGIELVDDWLGADVLADHMDDKETLRVQLKGRLAVDRKTGGQSLWMKVPPGANLYVVGHDELPRIVGEETTWLATPSWTQRGQYHSRRPPRALLEWLAPDRVGGPS